jgi:hypothetical protein
MEYQQERDDNTAIPRAHPSRILPVPRLSTILALLVVAFLIYAFFSGMTKQFYASVVFLFYSLTNSMWVSVVMLGIFQTLLLIPFRIINLLKSAHIQEFKETLDTLAVEKEQSYFLKKSVKRGRRVALYYFVNFFVQTTSYMSIGRLFLTDFYTKPLDPNLLYGFVPYPDYPIVGRFYNIPYLWFRDTVDLGMQRVWVAWAVILGIQALILLVRTLMKKRKVKPVTESAMPTQLRTLRSFVGYVTGSTVLMMVLAYFLIRFLPVGWDFRMFGGDVAEVNVRFNVVTSVIAFFLIIWVSLPKMSKKSDLARAAGIEEEVIGKTEKVMLTDTLKAATLVGFGTFFITNQIPSAFELSIFTLETITLFSPLTLDRMILATVKPASRDQEPDPRYQEPGTTNQKETIRKQGNQEPRQLDGQAETRNQRPDTGDQEPEAEKQEVAIEKSKHDKKGKLEGEIRF